MLMTAIVIPPVSDCFMPTLGAAQIVAYLRENYISTKLYDLSAELQQLILSRAEELPLVLSTLINGQDSLVQRYEAATNCLFGLHQNRTSAYRLTHDNFLSKWDWRNPDMEDLFTMHESLCILFRKLPSFPELCRSDSIGLSISYESQLIPSLLIAGLVKQERPQTEILFGGSFFYNYSEDFSKILFLSNLVDALIIGPGESILCSIAQNGLEKVVQSQEFPVQKIGEHYVLKAPEYSDNILIYEPDFSDLNFDQYLSTSKAFPYMIRNQCYYGQCKFCNGDRDCGAVQNKQIETAFQSMMSIANQTGIRNIYIVDAALSPRDLRTIALMDGTEELFWIANGRFEHALDDLQLLQKLYKNGCRMLRFGLESGSQRMLDLMNKGTDIVLTSRILKNCHQAGILNHVYIMFGYWGETAADREQTICFLEENKEYIDSYSISIFQPIPQTKVYQELLEHMESTMGDAEEYAYEHMLSLLYPSEEEYQALLRDIAKVKKVLHAYAHTNGEYYSANIFSQEYDKHDPLRIRSCMLFAEEQPQPQFQPEKELWMQYIGTDCVTRCGSIWDLSRSTRLHVEIPDWLWKFISLCDRKICFDSMTQEHQAIIQEFLAEVSQYVSFCDPQIFDSIPKHFRIESTGSLDLGNMSIQFSP